MQIGHRKDCFESWRCEHKPWEEQGQAYEGLTFEKSALNFFILLGVLNLLYKSQYTFLDSTIKTEALRPFPSLFCVRSNQNWKALLFLSRFQ